MLRTVFPQHVHIGAAALAALLVVVAIGLMLALHAGGDRSPTAVYVVTPTPRPTVTPTATPVGTVIPTLAPTPVSPLAPGTDVLSGVLCGQSNTACSNTTVSFTTSGPSFALVWVCYDRNYTGASGTGNAAAIAVYNSSGRQVDNLSEFCPGQPNGTGVLTETLPAGNYSIGVTYTPGPSFDLTVLGNSGAPSQ